MVLYRVAFSPFILAPISPRHDKLPCVVGTSCMYVSREQWELSYTRTARGEPERGERGGAGAEKSFVCLFTSRRMGIYTRGAPYALIGLAYWNDPPPRPSRFITCHGQNRAFLEFSTYQLHKYVSVWSRPFWPRNHKPRLKRRLDFRSLITRGEDEEVRSLSTSSSLCKW